jgi:hypothetical protein
MSNVQPLINGIRYLPSATLYLVAEDPTTRLEAATALDKAGFRVTTSGDIPPHLLGVVLWSPPRGHKRLVPTLSLLAALHKDVPIYILGPRDNPLFGHPTVFGLPTLDIFLRWVKPPKV